MTSGDTIVDSAIMAGFAAVAVLALVALALALRLAERVIPGLTEFLDRHVGPEDRWS